jgi:hypothetical protein
MYHIDGLGLLLCLFLNDGVAREVFGHWLSLSFEDSLLPEDWVVTCMDGRDTHDAAWHDLKVMPTLGGI